MAYINFQKARFLFLTVIIISILACNISYQGNELINIKLPSAGESAQETVADFPELSIFGELATVYKSPISVDVDEKAKKIKLYDGASIEIPAGAFPVFNRLHIARVDAAFDQIAPDVTRALFYVVSTEENVPILGKPVILEVPGFNKDVSVMYYDAGNWVSVPIKQGETIRLDIEHFSKGIFGFVEWWAERSEVLGDSIDSMDNNTKNTKSRISVEAGNEYAHAFFGVNESSDQTDTEICAEIIEVLKQYNKPRNREFPDVKGDFRDLGGMLIDGEPPSKNASSYWKVTENTMEDIRLDLIATQKPIGPADFLKIAIEANNGNIPLGILAAHNYLKDLTYKGRSAFKKNQSFSQEYGEPASHLRSWRQGDNITPEGIYDKMGPIYHIFVAMTGALWLPTSASGPIIASGEAYLRTARRGEDRPDTSKAAADLCGIDAAAWLRNHPPVQETLPAEVPTASASGRMITMTGTITPTGLHPGIRTTENDISITFSDDGKGHATGSGVYASIQLWEKCNKELPSSTRWELTGKYEPASHKFIGTMQEFGSGQITYTDCSVGNVPEYLNGQGGTWEAVFEDGVIFGSITLIQSGGTLLERITFELR